MSRPPDNDRFKNRHLLPEGATSMTHRSIGLKTTGFLGIAIAATTLLSACSGTPDCLKQPGYADARTLPALSAPPGLKVPSSDAEMVVPDVRNGPVAAYAQPPVGTEQDNPQSRCLTAPPPLNTGSAG